MTADPTPLTSDQRRGNYERQNRGGAMTPRQQRRWRKRLNAWLAKTKTAKSVPTGPRP